MQFCPACLAEDETPYFRKQWRLALYTYCPAHQAMLHDACPACSAPVSYFRKDFGRQLEEALDIGYCHVCGFDFRLGECRTPNTSDEDVHARFDSMLDSLANATPAFYSAQYGFFAVLHQLCQVMCMRQNGGRLQIFVNDQMGSGDGVIRPASRSIENLRIGERHRLLVMALWLLVDLDSKLAAAWQQKAVRYNLLIKDFDDKPGWYTDVVHRFSHWRKGLI